MFLVPKILTKQRKVVLAERSHRRVWFDCKTTGFPGPFIKWVFGKVTLNVIGGELNGVKIIVSLNPLKEIICSFEVYENGSLLIRSPYLMDHLEYNNFT